MNSIDILRTLLESVKAEYGSNELYDYELGVISGIEIAIEQLELEE